MPRLFLNLLVLLAVATSVAAQVPTPPIARVIGYVFTSNNTAVADAYLQLRDTVGGGVVATTRSNAAGEFAFEVPPGSYVIELADAAGGGLLALGHPFTVAAGETAATFVRLGASVIPRWEVGAGVIGSWRQASGGAPGFGVLFGSNLEGPAFVAEFSGVRRDGHTDWRALAGLRVGLVNGSRGVLFAHAMAGSMLRNGENGLAFAAGLGAEVGQPGRTSFRFQMEATRDTADRSRATGVRASAWVVVR